MKLYGINKDTLEVDSVDIVKETSELYYLKKRKAWMGYSLIVRKDSCFSFTTPEAAIEAFQNDLQDQIDKEYAQIEKLQEKLREFNYLHEKE